MGRLILATAIAVALAAGNVQAASTGTASKADVQALQAQMQALAERLNRLEAANAQLTSQNAELQALADRREAETDYLKAQTQELREESAVATNEIAKVKGADWAARIKGRGDLRYRHERLTSERDVNGAAEDAGQSGQGSHSRASRVRRHGHGQRQGYAAALDRGGRSPRHQPDAGRHQQSQADRPRPGVRRLALHAGGRPRARQAALPGLAPVAEHLLRS